MHEFGFIENELKSDGLKEVLTKDNFDIVFKDGNYYFSSQGIDYPLKDLAGLRKFYKENKNQNLNAI